MLEFSIGHKFHQAAPGSFKKISPRLEWFGWFAAGVGFIIVTYYAIIMAWSVNYTCEAATLGWVQEEGKYAEEQRRYINENSSFHVSLWWSICIRWIIPMGILWMIFTEIKERAVPYGSFGLRSQEFLFGWLLIIILPIIGDILASVSGKKEPEQREVLSEKIF